MGIRRFCLCFSLLAALSVPEAAPASSALSARPGSGAPRPALASDEIDGNLGRCRPRVNNGTAQVSGPGSWPLAGLAPSGDRIRFAEDKGDPTEEDCIPSWVLDYPDLLRELVALGCKLCSESKAGGGPGLHAR